MIVLAPVPWVPAALGVGAAVTLGAWSILARSGDALVRPNYAGRPVPAVLGLATVGGVLVGMSAALVVSPGYELRVLEVTILVAVAGVAAAGLGDDMSGSGPRGIAAHVASLLRGRPTTGILKLVAGAGAGVAVAWVDGGGALRIAAGAVLIAVSANLWNGLDVVPGRSLKWGLLAMGALLSPSWDEIHVLLVAATLGSVLVALPFDLRERGMLGDAGANALGLVVGIGLFLVLPTAGLLAAAAVALLLQLAAETITLSHLIDSVPPLRWLDRLGRSRR